MHHNDPLPPDVLRLIFPLVDAYSLCALATLCRSFHVFALDELFNRTQALRAATTPPPYLLAGSAVRPIGVISGTCIYLTTPENLEVLLGLRLALPSLFDEHQITAVVCRFNDPLTQFFKELESLGRLLTMSPIASTLEAVLLNFHPAMTDGVKWEVYPNLKNTEVLRQFLSIFGRTAAGEMKLPRCTSLSLMNGHIPISAMPTKLDEPGWLREGSTAANTLQAVLSKLSKKFALSFRPNRGHTLSGLQVLNIHSSFVFHRYFLHSTLNFFAQHSNSLRILSLSKTRQFSNEWPPVLARMFFPNLEELYLHCDVPMDALINFLTRHPNIKTLAATEIGPKRWRRPPFFLPKLTMLMGWPPMITHFLRPSAFRTDSQPFPGLQVVTFTIHIESRLPFFCFTHNMSVSSVAERLSTITLGLKIHLKLPCTRWLEDEDADERGLVDDAYKRVKFIEIIVRDYLGFLEVEGVRMHLPAWLTRFPMVERLEMKGCHPPDEEMTERHASRQKLFRSIAASNPGIESILLDGAQVL